MREILNFFERVTGDMFLGVGAFAGPGGEFATGAVGNNVVDQAIGPDGIAVPDVTTPEGRAQLATEIAAGDVTNIIGGATGDAVRETVSQVADSVPVGQLVGSEGAGNVAEGTVAFFSNTVTNAV
jgi:hypothetical protein